MKHEDQDESFRWHLIVFLIKIVRTIDVLGNRLVRLYCDREAGSIDIQNQIFAGARLLQKRDD